MPSTTTRHSRTTRSSKVTRGVRGGQALVPLPPPPPNSVTVGATVRTSAFRPGIALVGGSSIKHGTTINNLAIAVMGAGVSDVIVHAASFGQRTDLWPAQATPAASWNWSDLDTRIDQINAAGCRAYVMLGMAPPWMFPAGTDVNTQFYPNANAADATNFARTIAQRYAPGGAHNSGSTQLVYGYCLYNEFKGLWSVSLNRPRYEDFTTIYNGMYSAIKAVSSAIKVGGPYFPTPGRTAGQAGYVSSGAKYINTGVGFSVDTRYVDAFNYWYANKTGADFVCFDGCNRYPDNLANWLLVTKGVTEPIMWAEFYAGNGADPYYSGTPTTKEKALRLIHNLIIGAYAGAGSMCPWGGEVGAAPPFPENGLWTSSGIVTDTGNWMKMLKDNFSAGTTLKAFTSNNDGIVGIASDVHTLILNKTSVDQVTDTPGGTVTLGAKTVTLQ